MALGSAASSATTSSMSMISSSVVFTIKDASAATPASSNMTGEYVRMDARAARPALLTSGALLGVGAHFVNVLPDLEDDARPTLAKVQEFTRQVFEELH